MTSVGVAEALDEDEVAALRPLLLLAVLLLLFEADGTVELMGFMGLMGLPCCFPGCSVVVVVGGGIRTRMAASMTSTPVATSPGERAARSQRLAVRVATKAASEGVLVRPWKAARRHEMASRGREAAQ